MKKILVVIILFLFTAFTSIHAADINVSWNKVTGAADYKMELTEDGGTTWTPVLGLTYTPRTEGTLNLIEATITVPDNILVLGRVGAVNTAGVISWRLESGIFYNSLWKPLPAPTGVGIQ